METSRHSALTIILNTFFICIVAYFLEYKFLYAYSISIFGTTIFCKIFGILAILVAMYLLKSNLRSIGYIAKPKKIASGIIAPIVVLSICAVVSFVLIKLLVESQGASLEISYQISISSLEPDGTTSPSYISFITAIISALVSSVMLETLLRGLVLQTANRYLRFYAANTINVALTIIWHIVIYIFSFIFNNMKLSTFLISLVFTCIIYATAAVRKSLYTRASGTIWACLADCFFSLMVIHNLPITINFPTNATPTNTIGYLVSLMSSKATNSSYATIAFLCMVNILSLIVMVVYCHILKKKARNKYLNKISEEAKNNE